MRTISLFVVLCLFAAAGCTADSTATLKEKAAQSLDAHDYEQAVTHLEQALSGKPEDQETHYLLGQTYRQLLFDDGAHINNVDPALAAKSSQHFRNVIDISPVYEGRTFTVGPYSKIQGIWGAVAMTCVYNDRPDSALRAFRRGQAEGGFYPAIMEYNKNIMASCEKDAILFTNGDNDTYPMWFLQFVEGYRKDITVVNLSLLNVPWYIQQLKISYPYGDNNIQLNFTNPEIAALKYQPWQKTAMRLPVVNDPLNASGEIQWTVEPTVANKIIRVQDIVVMDILKANKWVRPIYFSTTVYHANKIGLDPYLAFEGLVFKLNSHTSDLPAERLYENCVNTYTYAGLHDPHVQYVDELMGLLQNYRAGFVRLAGSFVNNGQYVKAKETLEMMDRKLPENLLPYRDQQMKHEIEVMRKAASHQESS